MEKPLFWHQGLFLQPQHLQINDRHHHYRFKPYHRHLQPYLTGVIHLKVRESSLRNGVFQLDEGGFWFNDHTYAVIGENAVIEPRPLAGFWDESGDPLTVYVGIRRFADFGMNVTTIKNGGSLYDVNTRYITTDDAERMDDLHQGGAPAEVKRLTHLLKVYFHPETDRLGNYELVPVARVEKRGDRITLSETYIPPCISVNSSPVLSGLLQEVLHQITYHGRELELHKKKRGIHNAEFGSRDMVYLLTLRTFNRYIPLMAHMLEGADVHPFQLYGAIRQMIGELSSFSDAIDVHGVEEGGHRHVAPYDHNDLWTCFSNTRNVISTLIDEITAGPEYVIPFISDAPYFNAPMKPEHLDGNHHYYIVFRTNADVKQVLDAVEIEVKLSSLKVLPVLVERSLPGAVLEYTPTPPQELPRRNDFIYFRIDNHCEQWAQVESDKTVSLYWEFPPEDMSMELMIIRRR